METLGNLYIVSAPSGAGKSSLINALIKDSSNIKVSVSHTTRSPRPGEINGEHYYFVSKEEFKSLIENNCFLEWAEVFGNYYGTSLKMIDDELKKGIDIFLDIDWQGARQIRELIPNTNSIFILPPSRNELENRLKTRGQDSLDVIKSRMDKAVAEIVHYDEFDYIIVNDIFDEAIKDLNAIIRSNKQKLAKQKLINNELLKDLLAY